MSAVSSKALKPHLPPMAAPSKWIPRVLGVSRSQSQCLDMETSFLLLPYKCHTNASDQQNSNQIQKYSCKGTWEMQFLSFFSLQFLALKPGRYSKVHQKRGCNRCRALFPKSRHMQHNIYINFSFMQNNIMLFIDIYLSKSHGCFV